MWHSINKRFPVSLYLMAAYPAVFLLEVNFKEIEPVHIFRPLIFSFIVATVIFLAFLKIFKDREKAGVLATLFVFIIFLYGRVFNYLSLDLGWTQPLGNLNHLLVALAAAGLFWLFNQLYNRTNLLESSAITVISATLLLLPGYQIARNFLRDPYPFTPVHVEIPDSFYAEPQPDIYHIVVDAYAREDQLARMGYDNSEFIANLREQGFYVADCARSNYSRTALSMTSILNLDYMWRVIPNQPPVSRNDAAVYAALSNNLAQNTLRDAGYTFITNKNGFVWSEMSDHADLFIAPKGNSFFAPYLLPFERVFLENSAFRLFLDMGVLDTYRDGYLLQGEHYEQVTTALEALKEIPSIPGPKYAYFHLIVPHAPNVFNPDGSLAPAIANPQGYLRNIEFINNALTPILAEIIAKSETPPIIILHGDHGYIADESHRYDILNAVYYPTVQDQLYPTLSPMNTYRLIFKDLFDLDLILLQERSIQGDIGHPFSRNPADLPALPDYCPQTPTN